MQVHSRGSFLTLLSAASLVVPPALAQAADKPKELVLLGYGGPFDEVTRRVVAEPFTKETGIPVVIRGGSSSLTSALLAQRERPQYDLVHIGYDAYTRLNRSDVFDPIDYTEIPNARTLYPVAKYSHGLATTITAVTIVYNTEKIKTAPTSWNDLWNPAYKGHVAISSMPETYGIDLLVMAARLNGGNEYNIEPGFAKLKELKPNILAIYSSSSQCAQLFQQGGAWLAPWYSGRVQSTRASGVPVAAANPKEGSIAYLTALCPLKGRYNPYVAKFMNMHLAVEVQQAFAQQFASGPSRTDVRLDPQIARNVPYGRAEVGKLLQFDWNTIETRIDGWTQRFIREIAT